MTDDQEQAPESLLPYGRWTEEALRHVVARALDWAATQGLPGEHHFYLTFRTDHPGTVIPPRLRTQYPAEMTIVLQHQFWDLKVDEEAGLIGVSLSFGGVPATLAIPLDAVTAFSDPHVRFGLRFEPVTQDGEPPPDSGEEVSVNDAQDESTPAEPGETPQVVSLDAFRRRTTSKD